MITFGQRPSIQAGKSFLIFKQYHCKSAKLTSLKNHLHIKRPWVDHTGEERRHLVVARWEWEAEGREEWETVWWDVGRLPMPVGEAGWEPGNDNYNDYNDNGKPGGNLWCGLGGTRRPSRPRSSSSARCRLASPASFSICTVHKLMEWERPT